MKQFVLNRMVDESGVSGIGYVSTGVILPSGKVVMEWLRTPNAVSIYDSIEDLISIHGHEGSTIVEYIER